MAKTTIEWATDVWNPVTGCTKVSEGCRNCYAEGIAKRFWGDRPFTEVRCHEHKLEEPLHWRKPRRVFVNSMSDLFHPDVPFSFIDRVFAVMALTPHITYMILTKRADRMLDYFSNPDALWSGHWPEAMQQMCGESEPTVFPLPNVWLGATAENQQAADERIPLLLQTPAAVRFVSVEPMLGAVDLHNESGREDYDWLTGENYSWDDGTPSPREKRTKLDWVICGGESGSNARPMHPDWPRDLRDQCKAAGVPFMFKQWGEWAPSPDGGLPDHLPSSAGYYFDEPPYGKVWRFGKKAAGRLLDGVEHNEYPEVQNG